MGEALWCKWRPITLLSLRQETGLEGTWGQSQPALQAKITVAWTVSPFGSCTSGNKKRPFLVLMIVRQNMNTVSKFRLLILGRILYNPPRVREITCTGPSVWNPVSILLKSRYQWSEIRFRYVANAPLIPHINGTTISKDLNMKGHKIWFN